MPEISEFELKKLAVPEFTKDEICAIVKDFLKQNPEIIDEVNASRTLDEVIQSYPAADDILEIGGEPHDITPEIFTFIEKCIKVGKIKLFGYCMSLNFVYDFDVYMSVCFGCMTSNHQVDHDEYGSHLEISIDKENHTYTAYHNEV